MITFAPLWNTMKEKNCTTYTLREKYKLSSSTVSRLKNNLPVTTNTLDILCEILDCRLQDIAEYVPGKK